MRDARQRVSMFLRARVRTTMSGTAAPGGGKQYIRSSNFYFDTLGHCTAVRRTAWKCRRPGRSHIGEAAYPRAGGGRGQEPVFKEQGNKTSERTNERMTMFTLAFFMLHCPTMRFVRAHVIPKACISDIFFATDSRFGSFAGACDVARRHCVDA